MKKLIALIVIFSLLLSNGAFAAVYASDTAVNASQAVLDEQIEELFSARQRIKMADPVDTAALLKTEEQLSALGVQFLDSAEKAQEIASISANASRAITDTSSVEMAEYNSTYTYQGTVYAIRKLYVQTALGYEDESRLWVEDVIEVHHIGYWDIAEEILLFTAATWSSPISDALTIMDAFQWAAGLAEQADTGVVTLDVGEAIYWIETGVTAVFTYVRLASASEDTEILTLVSTKCDTAVSYIVDVESYKLNGTGAAIAYPGQETGSYDFESKPSKYANTETAVINFRNNGVKQFKTVNSVEIRGLGNELLIEQTIDAPPTPDACYA